VEIFDLKRVRHNKNRAALSFHKHSFLFEAVEHQLIERLQDIQRPFTRILILGVSCPSTLAALRILYQEAQFFVIGHRSLKLLETLPTASPFTLRTVLEQEEWPFPPNTFDLIIDSLSLHWVNNVPKALENIYASLEREGFFLSALFGGETLSELRQALIEAELDLFKGASPRISPFIEALAASRLIQKTGFLLPVIDRDVLKVSHSSLLALLKDIQGMGENKAFLKPLLKTEPKSLFKVVEKILPKTEAAIHSSFEVIYLSGWKP
jgi:SAM-dependent methyltransferase